MRQWYLKFNDTIRSFDFIENIIDRCINMEVTESKFIVLVLYVNHILLSINNFDIFHDIKKFLSNNFEMKDVDERSYAIRI